MNIPAGKRYSTTLGGRELVLETGKYAKLVSGSVTVRYGDTLVLVTAHMSDTAAPTDFLPLTVEYEERHYAIGKIPGSFQKREGRPGNQATLNARVTDRQIRPLFPKGLRNEVQVIITVLSADQRHDPLLELGGGVRADRELHDDPEEDEESDEQQRRLHDAEPHRVGHAARLSGLVRERFQPPSQLLHTEQRLVPVVRGDEVEMTHRALE